MNIGPPICETCLNSWFRYQNDKLANWITSMEEDVTTKNDDINLADTVKWKNTISTDMDKRRTSLNNIIVM